MRCCGESTSTYSSRCRLRNPQRLVMCRSRLRAVYCVNTSTRRSPLLRQLDRVKSMIRYSPPNGTAGLARSRVRGSRRVPLPPASTSVRTSFMRPGFPGRGRAPACMMAARGRPFKVSPVRRFGVRWTAALALSHAPAMNTEAEFVAAIAANPYDDLLRGAFADWLEERGDRRAPWVRSHHVLEWMGPSFEDPIPKLIASLKRRKRVIAVRDAA